MLRDAWEKGRRGDACFLAKWREEGATKAGRRRQLFYTCWPVVFEEEESLSLPRLGRVSLENDPLAWNRRPFDCRRDDKQSFPFFIVVTIETAWWKLNREGNMIGF